MADTDSALQLGNASVELKKELLSKATPQNAKSCAKFAFNDFEGKSHGNFTRHPFC